MEQSTSTDVNTKIWDALYEAGNYLTFPSEVFVQLYFRLLGKSKARGSFLDHGCGSGNNSEFLAKLGWTVTGSDVSAKALEVQRKRVSVFGEGMQQTLLHSDKSLSGQLQSYSQIVVWDSLCYNRYAKAKDDAAQLAKALLPGGYLFINMPTAKHEFATQSLRLPDGSYQNNRLGKQQEGAIMTIPDGLEDLASWFVGLSVVERGHFLFDFSGYREFMVLVLQKPSNP